MTSRPISHSLKPAILDGQAGKLFTIVFEPQAEIRGQVLLCPPFAEEMNKSRRMMAETARTLASHGFAAMMIDLYGTGDSGGAFEDARWDTWIADLQTGLDHLAGGRTTSTTLCGLRLGALMALEIQKNSPESVDQLLLWQPLLSGKTHMTQFMRLKIAAGLTGSGPSTTTRELREAAARGDIVEIAGYAVHPDLIAAIDALDMRQVTPPLGVPTAWFEVVPGEGGAINVASRKLGESWRESGVDLEQQVVVGEQFWATPEIGMAARLIKRSVDSLASV